MWKRYLDNLDLSGGNLEAIDCLIGVMERVRDEKRKLYLRSWRMYRDFNTYIDYEQHQRHLTENDAVELGVACCVGGWLAISPEFEAMGGTQGPAGQPLIEEYSEGKCSVLSSMSVFFGLPEVVVRDIFFMKRFNELFDVYSCLSPTADCVLKRLYYIRERVVADQSGVVNLKKVRDKAIAIKNRLLQKKEPVKELTMHHFYMQSNYFAQIRPAEEYAFAFRLPDVARGQVAMQQAA